MLVSKWARIGLLSLPLALVGLTGCGGARMVQSTPTGGVVTIPSNTDAWPFHYRQEAEKLMAQKCPQGYTIDHEEEVVVGQQTMNQQSTNTQTQDLINRKQLPVGSVTSTDTTHTTTTQNLTEYRITFHGN
jgi:hypothetical protein